MKVILQEDVANVGSIGQIVTVADGYGRNYLLPRSLAVLADERNTRRTEHVKRLAAARQGKLLAAAREFGAKISALTVSIKRQAGAEDKLFGAVTNQDVQEALAAHGVEVDRRQITLAEPIRSLGVFHVPVKVHKDVEAAVKVFVIRA